MPLAIGIGIILCLIFLEHIYDFLLFLGVLFFSFCFIYFERFNSIEIIFQEQDIDLNFFLIGKRIKIKYSDILVFEECFGKVSGSTLRFKVIHNNKKYVFRLYGYTKELYEFVKPKIKPDRSDISPQR